MGIPVGVFVCVLSHFVLAQTQHVGMFGLINLLYLKADTDLNGIITPTELDSVYNGFDLDKNGKVTSQEFVPVWETITGFPHEMASAYFLLADLNADGVVDNKDLTILYGRFDIDGNGHVSAAEFNKKWQLIYRESPLAVLFARADADSNEHLDHTEFSNLFESFDANHNHVISKTEFEHGWTKSLFGSPHDADVFFRHLDASQNNHLNVHELHNLFNHYDANHNHQITMVELVKMADIMAKPLTFW